MNYEISLDELLSEKTLWTFGGGFKQNYTGAVQKGQDRTIKLSNEFDNSSKF